MLFKLMFTSFENGTGYLLAGNVKFEFGMKVEEMFVYLRVFCETDNMCHIPSQFTILLAVVTAYCFFSTCGSPC